MKCQHPYCALSAAVAESQAWIAKTKQMIEDSNRLLEEIKAKVTETLGTKK